MTIKLAEARDGEHLLREHRAPSSSPQSEGAERDDREWSACAARA